MAWGRKPKKRKKRKVKLPRGFWGKLGVARTGSRKRRIIRSLVVKRYARMIYPIIRQMFSSKRKRSTIKRKNSNWKSKRRLASAIAKSKRERKTKDGLTMVDLPNFVKDPVIKQSFGAKQLYDTGQRGKVDFPDFVKDTIKKQSFASAPSKSSMPVPGKRSFATRGKRPSKKPNGKLDWHVGAWNFKVNIDGIPLAESSFQSVSGINTETEMIEFKFGPDPFMRTMPGKTKFGTVELARVYKMGTLGLYNWRRMAENGANVTRNVRIDVYGANMKQAPVMSLVLHDCYPTKWDCPDLNAGSSEGAIEKLSLNVGRVTTSLGGTRRPTKYD